MSSAPSLPLVLASASPRRRQLLAAAGVPFEVRPADLPEEQQPGESPRQLAERLAAEKALHVARTLSAAPLRLVLGADTVVVLDGEALGKPDDAAHAVALMSRLVGRSHRVVTGVAVVRSDGGTPRVFSVESEVHMRPAGEVEIRAYVATGESLDKAGAYAAQGEGRRFIDRIVGSESNVIGLPMDETLALLREAGFPLPRPAARVPA
jgi:septum formation protein